jgi:hypothetical protein
MGLYNLPDDLIYAYDDNGDKIALTRGDIAGRRSLFDEMRTTERTPIIELNASYGLSALRDKQTVAGTGAITSSGGEHNLSTGTTTASTAQLDSTERGRYYPGTSGECGIGIRAPGTYTGTAKAEWGYDDGTDGFGWGIDATGTYIYYTRNTSQTKVYQSSWGVDVMDGTGPSGYTLSMADGHIFHIDFSWYGYGIIEWYIVLTDSAGRQKDFPVHRYTPTTTNSIQNPNLPIYTYVSNGNTTTDYDLYVGGRQFSIMGRYIPSIRRTHERRLALGSVGTTFLPLVSFRRKSTHLQYPAKFHQVDLLVTVRVNGALTGASWGTPTNTTAAETCMEADVSATAISGGELIEAGLVSSASGAQKSGGFSNSAYELDIPNSDEITVCVRAITGTITVDCVMGIEEEW